MNIGERILLSLSKQAQSDEYNPENTEKTIDNALSFLENEYSNFGDMVSGKMVLDFGCGMGFQSAALVQKYNCSVVGIELHLKKVEKVIEYCKSHNMQIGRA